VYRTTQDVLELRRWAEAHGASPCRERAGRLVLSLPGEPCGEEVGWDEFEPTFVTLQYVFVYDDAPSSVRSFLGTFDEAHAFILGGCRGGEPVSP
jgi:hypothetical protein